MQKEKTVGILGGMGPEATVDLMARIIKNTRALDDADHVRCIVDNNPKVPSRIKALLENNGEDPGVTMADMARRLENWGADFLCIACNTAHNYYSTVCDAVQIPVLNMIELTMAAVASTYPEATSVGILASPAVRLTRLYDGPCAKYGIQPIFAAPDQEQRLLEIIKGVKAGHTGAEAREALRAVVNHLKTRGTQLAVVACTELGIIIDNNIMPTVDASEVLAKTIVEVAKGRQPLCGAATARNE